MSALWSSWSSISSSPSEISFGPRPSLRPSRERGVPRTIVVTIRRRSHRNSSVAPWYELTLKVRPMAHVDHSDVFLRRTTPDEIIRDAQKGLAARWRAGDTIHVV